MKLLRHSSTSLPERVLGFLRSRPVPQVTSFTEHSQYGPESCPDKVYPNASIKNIFIDNNIASAVSNKHHSGLFGYPLLSSPKGFYHWWFMCEEHCNDLVKSIISNPPSSLTIQKFDNLSNAICLFADCVKFIADNPPSQTIAEAASIVNINAHNYVETLNTNVLLYQTIKSVADNVDVMSNLTIEDKIVLNSFLHDMEMSGIHLTVNIHESYKKLMSEIAESGSNFIQMSYQPVKIPAEYVPQALKPYANPKNRLNEGALKQDVFLDSSGTDHFMPNVREFTWTHFNAFNSESEDELLNLLKLRLDLSKKVGFNSYAERELSHTMAGSPDSVTSFLQNLHSELKPIVKNEVEHIKFAKSDDERHDFSEPALYPWCGAYYSKTLNEKFLVENHNQGQMFLDMLEVHTVMDGLNRFCEDIFQISLVAELPMGGELVDQNIIKLAVFDAKEGLIGYIYADLFERENKDSRTCLHTIRCGTVNQLPAVLLQCCFQWNEKKITEWAYPKITLSQLQTLFHEFGHALHAILGRTQFQNTSGTRGPTDFAEIPSTLFENFICHPAVYYSVVAPQCPFESSHFQYGTNTLFNTPYTALETETSIVYSMLDQQLHSSKLPGLTTETSYRLFNEYSHLNMPRDSAWHHRFSHLYFYGARYYSYLWSRSIANLIFYNMFYDDPFNESAGLQLKEFLKNGSSVDYKASLEELVGYKFGEEEMIGAIIEPLREFKDSYLDKQDISKKWW